MVRSEAAEGGRRSRRYRAEDVRALKERKERRRDPEAVAEGALRWGAPVLESGITLVDGGRLFYRGRDVEGLAAGCSIEEVAALIWAGDTGLAAEIFPGGTGPPSPRVRKTLRTLGGLPPVEVFQALLPVVSAEDPVGYDLRPAGVVGTGARVLRLMAGVVGGGGGGGAGGAARAGVGPGGVM